MHQRQASLIAAIVAVSVCMGQQGSTFTPLPKEDARPRISMRVNEGQSVGFAGNAIILLVSVTAGRKPITFTGSDISISFETPDGKKSEFTMSPSVPKIAGPISLVSGETGWFGFYALPTEASRLAPGSYVVKAAFDVPAAGTKFATTIPFVVKASPNTPNAEQVEDHFLLWAEAELFRAKPEEALTHLEELLKAQPGSVAGLTMKGDAHMELRKPKEAAEAYGMALDAISKSRPEGAEPPRILLRKYQKAILESIKGLLENRVA